MYQRSIDIGLLKFRFTNFPRKQLVKSKALIREIGNIYPGLYLKQILATVEMLLTEKVFSQKQPVVFQVTLSKWCSKLLKKYKTYLPSQIVSNMHVNFPLCFSIALFSMFVCASLKVVPIFTFLLLVFLYSVD